MSKVCTKKSHFLSINQILFMPAHTFSNRSLALRTSVKWLMYLKTNQTKITKPIANA